MDEHLLALFKALLDDPDIQAKLQHIVRTAQQTAAPAPTLPKPQELMISIHSSFFGKFSTDAGR